MLKQLLTSFEFCVSKGEAEARFLIHEWVCLKSKLAQNMRSQASGCSLNSKLHWVCSCLVKVHLLRSVTANATWYPFSGRDNELVAPLQAASLAEAVPVSAETRLDSWVIYTLTNGWNLTEQTLGGASRHVPTQGWSDAPRVTAHHISAVCSSWSSFSPFLSITHTHKLDHGSQQSP